MTGGRRAGRGRGWTISCVFDPRTRNYASGWGWERSGSEEEEEKEEEEEEEEEVAEGLQEWSEPLVQVGAGLEVLLGRG